MWPAKCAANRFHHRDAGYREQQLFRKFSASLCESFLHPSHPEARWPHAVAMRCRNETALGVRHLSPEDRKKLRHAVCKRDVAAQGQKTFHETRKNKTGERSALP